MTHDGQDKLPFKKMVVVSHKEHTKLADGFFAVRGGFPRIKNEFAKHAREVRLCVPERRDRNGGPPVQYAANVTLSPLRSYRNRLGLTLCLPGIVTALWTEIGQADVVYAMCPHDVGVIGLCIARARRKPVFVSVDTDWASVIKAHTKSRLLGAIKAWLVKKTFYSAIKALADGVPTYVTGDAFLGAKKHWSQWVKTTINQEEIPHFVESSAGRLQRVTVVFAGRLSPEKNVEALIEVTAYLASQDCQISLIIIGDGPERTRLEQVARRRPELSIRFMGERPPEELIKTRFLGADIFILPSLEERQGKVLLEAMACSIPVIASRAGGIPSVVVDGYTGLLFDPYNADQLAVNIRKVIDDPRLRKQIVRNGYKFAEQHSLDRTVKKICEQVAEFYALADCG